MNDFHDIEQVPDFGRTVWVVKKDKKGKNDWWTLNNKDFTREQWFELCERNKFLLGVIDLGGQQNERKYSQS